MRKLLIPSLALARRRRARGRRDGHRRARDRRSAGRDPRLRRRARSTSSRTASSRSAPTTPRSRRGSAAPRRRSRGRSPTRTAARATSPPSRTRSRSSSASRRRRSSGRSSRSTTRSGRARSRSTSTSPRSRTTPERAKAVDFSKSYYFVNQAVVGRKGKPIAKAKSIAALKPYKLGAPGRDDELHLHHEVHQAVVEAARLRHERRRGPGAQERPDRRDRRRPPDRVLRHGGPGRRRRDRRQAADEGHEGALRDGVPEGQRAARVRRQGDRPAVGERDDQEAPDDVPGARRRARPEVADTGRSSRILGGATARGSSEARAVAIAVLSTLVVVAAIVVVVTRSPGWDEFKAYFFDWGYYRDSFPEIARRVLGEREALLDRRGDHPPGRAAPRRAAQPARARVLPDPRARDRLRRPVPRASRRSS